MEKYLGKMFYLQFCPQCNDPLARLAPGPDPSADKGQIVGCEKCDVVYEQISGGKCPSPGGETFKPLPISFREYQKEHPPQS